MKWLCVLALAACDAGMPRSSPEPTKKLVEVPPPQRDAMVPADAAVQTPALRGAHLEIIRTVETPQAECTRSSLHLRLIRRGHLVDEDVETSTCTGACTDADKRAGAEQVAGLEEAIAAGSATEGELDYNFTGCLETGVDDYRITRDVGGRDVALIADRYIGPHDGVDTAYRLATEVCGTIYVSDMFGAIQSHSWPMDRLKVMSGDGNIRVVGVGVIKDNGARQTMDTLLRVQLPVCPAAPQVDGFDVWPAAI